jgi:thymidylate synthase (FAD)
MKTKLVSLTQPLIRTNVKDGERLLTPEEHLVYCARVSNPNNQLNVETSAKLLNYCIKNKHWSIFEQIDATFEIKTSRAIAAQILRHKSASFQEFSQRYSEVTEFEPIELRLQGKTNRQVGDEIIVSQILKYQIDDHLSNSKELYKKLIEEGIAKECARFVLPLTTQTTIFMKNNLRGWIHYLELRCSEHTQKEHRLIALEIREKLKQLFPATWEALGW